MTASALRFGSSGSGARLEDGPLLTGQGRFTDDLAAAGQCFAAFARASVAHGVIRHVDTAAAARMPGVLAVFTAEDLARDGLGPVPPEASMVGRGGRPMVAAPIPVLAGERVRYVGEPIAIVVAQTAAEAQLAAETIAVTIGELPAAPSVKQALGPKADPISADAPDNVVLDWEDGDAAAVEAAFARAAHIQRVRLLDTRLAPSAMEPRAAIAEWNAADERYTLTATTQGVSMVRKLLATGVFKVPPEKIRVLTHDVGGGFGMKVQAYAEYAALLYAARRVARPVRWTASRLESFLTDTHGRDGILEGELALDADGKFLGLRARTTVGIGAYTSTFAAIFSTTNTKNCLSSVYVIPAIHFGATVVLTNAAPLGPYRGAGRPEAILILERLIDDAAAAMSIDRAELRRRNLVPASAMPYRTPNGPIYDSGDFETVLDKALALADWQGFPARRAEAEKRGRLRGIGIACFLEVAGGILEEPVDLRFEADGTVALRTGAQPMGQGQVSAFVPFLARKLGIDPAHVRMIQGDSDEVPGITPSVASRSMMMAGSATALAADEAIEKGRLAAGHLLEADPGDVEFADGRFRIGGTDRSIAIQDVATRIRQVEDRPEALANGIDAKSKFVSPQMSFPNGCHICEVEIDGETGHVDVVRYSAVDDVGTVMHETIVEGQIHGGIAQGLGQVLGEHVVYGDDGQLLTASFMDYVMPRAHMLPALDVGHHCAPCLNNPLGVKGAGESGVAGALPAGVSAVLDALRSRGVTHLDLPMTPNRIWAALTAARQEIGRSRWPA